MAEPLAAGIAVAVVSVLAVLAPLLGLSPWLITLVVGVALAALTLDAWRFAGRGGHLLAEALPGGQARLRRIAVHEAAHALVARAEAIPVQQVLVGTLACLRAGLACGGSTVLCPPDHAKLPLSELRRWSRVLQAGIVAEQLHYGAAAGGADDRSLLGRLWGLSGYDVTTAQREQRQARREVERALRAAEEQLLQQAEHLALAAPRLGRRPQPAKAPVSEP